MVNPQLVTYVRAELQKGKSRGDLQKELFLQGGWKATDVDEAFKAVDGVATPTQKSPKVHKKVRIIWVIILMLLAGYAGWWIRDRQQFLKIPPLFGHAPEYYQCKYLNQHCPD
ncbi:MAG: hypothetical protein KBB91_02785 [Candidatus Pacebacteria bacterium]|jgi:hypothetical protein|nr:hypothetical protein [Candidatus Paceibacterota bacterium]MBP9701063.1 hypothetical protein [Candidatus Paceibacterota bacterium]